MNMVLILCVNIVIITIVNLNNVQKFSSRLTEDMLYPLHIVSTDNTKRLQCFMGKRTLLVVRITLNPYIQYAGMMLNL